MYCFSKCCRLCLIKNNTLANIKCSGSDRISFLDKLGQLAPSLVANPRDYIIWICQQCLIKLEEAYSFIQHCFKSDAVLEQYCMQLINADTAQNKFIDSDVSLIQLTENMIKKESIPISVKEERLEDSPAFDNNQYYFESTITIDEYDLSSVDFKIKLELKQEESLNADDGSILNDEITVSEYDCDQPENVQQIDPLAGTSGENYISSCSDVPNDGNDHADNCNMNPSNLLTKNQNIKSRKAPNKSCFKCGICDKTFTQSRSLKQHEKLHSGEQLFKCKICSKQFVQSIHLINHERIHSAERSYECKICYKKCNHLGNLKRHEKIHTGERSFKCKICSKTFIQAGHLKEHERVHTGERPFKCKICSKTFIHSGHLKQHGRVHTGERPFKCKICSKTFIQSGQLKEHERCHTGVRPYKCKICNKTFTMSRVLKIHERVHTGERPFKCKICSKQFTDNRSRKKHEGVHSGDRS